MLPPTSHTPSPAFLSGLRAFNLGVTNENHVIEEQHRQLQWGYAAIS